jgi:hypothetical protein
MQKTFLGILLFFLVASTSCRKDKPVEVLEPETEVAPPPPSWSVKQYYGMLTSHYSDIGGGNSYDTTFTSITASFSPTEDRIVLFGDTLPLAGNMYNGGHSVASYDSFSLEIFPPDSIHYSYYYGGLGGGTTVNFWGVEQ